MIPKFDIDAAKQMYLMLGGPVPSPDNRDMTPGPWCEKLQKQLDDEGIIDFKFTPGPGFNQLSLEEAAQAMYEFLNAPSEDITDQLFQIHP